MEIKQETKSLPRNRKCGNCRYFEPAPLWRKGWCRNPRLYDRRANHLVDAATIDCEQVFRARIYWEPIPTTQIADTEAGYSPFVGSPAADSGVVEGGRNRVPGDGVLRARSTGTTTPTLEPREGNLPVIARRERAAATPGLVAKPSPVRRWLVENIPYYDKIDGPISRINYLRVLPWFILGVLMLVVILNVLGPKKETASTPTSPSSSTTTSPSSSTTSNLTGQPSVAASNNRNSLPTATPTLSSLVPTSTPVPAPSATPRVTETYAKVVTKEGVNLRKDPGTQGTTTLRRLPQGARVKIKSTDFRTIEGGVWWPVTFEGQDGWVLSTFLEKENPN